MKTNIWQIVQVSRRGLGRLKISGEQINGDKGKSRVTRIE